MWQTVHFKHDANGWRVSYATWSFRLIRPFVQSLPTRNRLVVAAEFKTKIRAGQFCKRPHTYIDFVNSYERKDK